MNAHVPHKMISEWLDRQCLPGDAIRVERHLDACNECRSVAAELASVNEIFRAAEKPELPPYLWTRIEARLGEENLPARAGTWSDILLPGILTSSRRGLALALSAVLVLAAGIFIARQTFHGRSFDLAMAEIDRAQIALVELHPDGFNPFSRPAGLETGMNPFAVHTMDFDSNPFQSPPDRR